MKEEESACPVSLGTITYHYASLIVLLGILLSAGSLSIVDGMSLTLPWPYFIQSPMLCNRCVRVVLCRSCVSSFSLPCLSIALNIDLDDLGFMNKGPSDEVIHTQRESSVGQWGRRVVSVVLST